MPANFINVLNSLYVISSLLSVFDEPILHPSFKESKLLGEEFRLVWNKENF
jgi:hypothetical protein